MFALEAEIGSRWACGPLAQRGRVRKRGACAKGALRPAPRSRGSCVGGSGCGSQGLVVAANLCHFAQPWRASWVE